MYAISSIYKNHINSSYARTPKNKVILEGVEYLDNVLMSTPLFSHSNDKFIGGFPSKTCSFEIKDNGTMDLRNKWITVYKGLEIDGVVEWILMGSFKALTDDDIKTNKSKKTISFKGYDKRQLLDNEYLSSLDWNSSHTGLEIVLEVCSSVGLELESTNFNFASYVFTQKPNFPSGITKSEVISRIAELGGEMALVTRQGKVHIKGQTTTDVVINKKKRTTLTKEKEFKITSLVLSNESYTDDVVYQSDAEGNEWRIVNNPFVELNRETIINDIAPFIIGKSIIPFEMGEVIDDYYLDLNDSITIVDTDDSTFTSTILSYETINRVKSSLKAPSQVESVVDYAISGGIAKSLHMVKLEVNHNTNQIKGLVSTTNDLTTKTSEVIQSAEEHTTTFYEDVIKEQIDELTGKITQEVETRSSGMRVTTDADNNVVIGLGSSSSRFSLEAKNTGIYLNEDGETLQEMANGFVKTPNLEVTNVFKMGRFGFKPRANGNTSLVKVSEE